MSDSRKLVFGRFDYAIFLTYLFYAAGSVVIPVALVQVAHDLQFPLEAGGMSAGGGIQLGRTFSMVATMLLCGFAAGWWGTRHTLGYSLILMATGIGLSALAPNYAFFFIVLLIAGLGEGVIEGLATPFIQDLHPKEPGRYINFSHSFWSIGVLVTVLLSGALLAWGVPWRPILGVLALLTLLPVLLFVLPARPADNVPDHAQPLHWREVAGHAKEVLRLRRFWLFYAAMFLAGGGEFCLTFWSASHIQLQLGGSAWSGGVGTACFAGGMVLGRTGWGFLIRQQHLKHLVVYSAIGGALVTLTLPWISNLNLFYFLLFLSGLATAPFWPSVQSYAVDRLKVTSHTMLLILLSCAGVPGCGLFSYVMGVLGNWAGGNLTLTFYLVPACYLGLGVMILYDWLFLPPCTPESACPAPAPSPSGQTGAASPPNRLPPA